MKKAIGLINYNDNLEPLLPLLEELTTHNYKLFLFSAREEDSNMFAQTNWPCFKISCPPKLDSFGSRFAFFFLYPVYSIKAIYKIWAFRRKQPGANLFCFGKRPMIIYGLAAHFFKLSVYSFILPERAVSFSSGYTRLFLGKAKIITFTKNSFSQLEKAGINKKNLHYLPLGIKTGHLKHQDTIFSQLAEATQRSANRKFFTVGTITDLDKNQNLETLFLGVKKIKDVINNIQLIIVGDGDELKNLKWLAQKMGIDTLVWFVGRATQIKKWLDSLDAYVVGTKFTSLADLNNIIHTAAAGLPIICPRNIGLDCVLPENTSLWFKDDDDEALAQDIIKLYKNRRLRQDLGKTSIKLVEENYNLNQTTATLISWLAKNK